MDDPAEMASRIKGLQRDHGIVTTEIVLERSYVPSVTRDRLHIGPQPKSRSLGAVSRWIVATLHRTRR